VKIERGRIFNGHNGMDELDRFRKQVAKEMKKCRCKYCKERAVWKDLGK
jgi:hypothetical protein